MCLHLLNIENLNSPKLTDSSHNEFFRFDDHELRFTSNRSWLSTIFPFITCYQNKCIKYLSLFLDKFLNTNYIFLWILGRPGRDPGHDPSWVMTQIFLVWVMTQSGHVRLGHDRSRVMTQIFFGVMTRTGHDPSSGQWPGSLTHNTSSWLWLDLFLQLSNSPTFLKPKVLEMSKRRYRFLLQFYHVRCL